MRSPYSHGVKINLSLPGGTRAASASNARGFDVGASLEMRATTHVFARAAFDYQQFAWSWAMVGSATDGYPTATLAGGAIF